MRRVVLALVALACVAAVVGFQVTRPVKAAGDPQVFVPSSHFYEKLSPSYRTSIADLYWLGIVQYYGEHIEGDRRLDSLSAMLDLVTALSPHFIEPYLFSTFALADAGQPQTAYRSARARVPGQSPELAVAIPARLLGLHVRPGQGEEGPHRSQMVHDSEWAARPP